eukprot:gene10619-22165_t
MYRHTSKMTEEPRYNHISTNTGNFPKATSNQSRVVNKTKPPVNRNKKLQDSRCENNLISSELAGHSLHPNQENLRNGSIGGYHSSSVRRREETSKVSKSLEWERSFKTSKDLRRSYDTNISHANNYDDSNPFVFDINIADSELCVKSNNEIFGIRQSLYYNPEIDHHLTQIYIVSNSALCNYAHFVANEANHFKQRATEEWLQSRSEEERSQYLSRARPLSIIS